MNDVEDDDIIVATHDDNDEDESTYRHVKKKNKAINIGESVLGTCPVCGCDVHRVLIQEHVEFCLTGKHRVRDEKENAKTLRDRTNYDEPHREEENEKRKKKKKKPNAQFSILKFLQKKKQREEEEEEEKKSDETETTRRTNDNNTNNNNSNNNNNNASIDDAEMNEEEEEEVDLIAINTQIEGGKIPDKVSFLLNTMSGNYSE